jgi:hypothetical protein
MASTSRTTPAVPSTTRVEAGDHLEQVMFYARYKAMPLGFRAELIGGVVIVPSPLLPEHGEYHALVVGWLTNSSWQRARHLGGRGAHGSHQGAAGRRPYGLVPGGFERTQAPSAPGCALRPAGRHGETSPLARPYEVHSRA